MFDDSPPPVMRGDLFALLDPDQTREAGRKAVTPNAIARAAKKLVQRVELGERAPGAPVVMQCLEELALIEGQTDPMRAFSTLSSIRQRLKSLGLARSRGLPGVLTGERALVLPQSAAATVCRVLPAMDHRVWYVVTREAVRAYRWKEADDVFAGAPERPGLPDSAIGPPRVEPTEVTFRLHRFGESSADIRLCMRVVQEPGSFCEVLAAGDGRRVAMLSRDVIGVFDGDGRPVLSGRLPIGVSGPASEGGASTGAGQARVSAMALDGDILGLNIFNGKGPVERPAELALIAISERRGFPVGTVGEDASGLLLGPRQAYVLDGVQLVRLPLFSAPLAEEVALFPFRPWFAEYPWSARHLMAWDGQHLWLSNGAKLVVLSDRLDAVLAEIVLPEPIIDFSVTGNEVRLVHWDAQASRLRIAAWELR